MGRIVWLASYPKSGNTWVRAFLTNYLRKRKTPADIDDLEGKFIASDRHLFDEMVGVEASDLGDEEVAMCRAEVFRRFVHDSDETHFIKVHDGFDIGGVPLFPADVSALAVYIIRNPLDVSISLAHHHGVSLDVAVDRMCRGFTLSEGGDRLKAQLPQVLPPWSDHVRSWVEQGNIPVLVLRYEDLVREPHAAFLELVERLGLEIDRAGLARAIAFSSFDVLRAQEQSHGFIERPSDGRAFFRGGRVGGGEEALHGAQVRRLVAAHGEMMRRFRYLGDRDEPFASRPAGLHGG